MTEVVLAVALGAIFALGTFLVLRRDLVRVVWGVAIISQAANLYLVTMGGIGGAAPVLAGHGGGGGAGGNGGGHGAGAAAHITDPLVQALVLTAIVIGFGTTAFALVLTFRVYQEHGTLDVAELASRRDGAPGGGRAGSGSGPGGEGE